MTPISFALHGDGQADTRLYHPAIDIAGKKFTLWVWVYVDEVNAGPPNLIWCRRYHLATKRWALQLVSNAGAPYQNLIYDNSGGNDTSATPTYTIPLTTWTLMCFEIDNSVSNPTLRVLTGAHNELLACAGAIGPIEDPLDIPNCSFFGSSAPSQNTGLIGAMCNPALWINSSAASGYGALLAAGNNPMTMVVQPDHYWMPQATALGGTWIDVVGRLDCTPNGNITQVAPPSGLEGFNSPRNSGSGWAAGRLLGIPGF